MVLQAGSEPCSMYVDFEYWKPINEVRDDEQDSRRMRWVTSHGLTEGVHVGAARLPVEGCTVPGTGKGWLKLDGAGDEEFDRYEVPLEAVAAGQEAWNRHKGQIEAFQQHLWRQRVADERSREDAEQWRASFRRARERLSLGRRRRSAGGMRTRPPGRTCASRLPTRRWS